MRRTAVALAALAVSLAAHAQVGQRIVDIIDASKRDDHVNITIQFSCTMRYIAHNPATAGSETLIRFRPGQDCGLGLINTGLNEIPSVAGSEGLLKNARLEDGAPGEVNLSLQWSKPTTYVVAPTGDQRGFVIRVIQEMPKGQIIIQEEVQPSSVYAINLDSRTKDYTPEEIAAATSRFGAPAYVSTTVLDGVTWYRLRIGPVTTRKDADQLLSMAQGTYPRAWLVIGEESGESAPPGAGAERPAAGAASDAPLPDDQRAKLMADAKAAMAKRNFTAATESLTVLVRQPEFPARAQAQELLGLSRERAGQLAHAKAEYEEYLRRYPTGPAADRIRTRLKTLAVAGRKPRNVRDTGEGEDRGWFFSGGVSQLYRRDQNKVTTSGQSFDQTSQNAVINYGDLLARRRGERFEFLSRVYAGYTKSLVRNDDGTSNSQFQVNAAFIELTDKNWNLTGRLGRQSRGTGGVFGSFDGAWVAYRMTPRITVNLTYGYPVDTVTESPKTQRTFQGISLDLGTFAQSWDFSIYGVTQKFEGETDRRAVGLETRYFRPGRSLIALVDYDTYFKSVNNYTLIGSLSLPRNWLLSVNADRRNAPLLTIRNALIGQPVTTLADLAINFTQDEINQFARDRTARSDVYAITLAHPLGERYSISTDFYMTKTDGTPASGNVPASPASGTDRALQFQIFGTSLWKSSDLHVLSLRYEKSDTGTTESVALSSRLPIFQQWRIGPRLRADRIHYDFDDTTQLTLSPSLRLELLRSRTLFEFELGSDFGSRNLPLDKQKTHNWYVSLGYRLGF
ncbi:MAG: SPOR domain-containing protein [Steroidobacteraceae bacterium]